MEDTKKARLAAEAIEDTRKARRVMEAVNEDTRKILPPQTGARFRTKEETPVMKGKHPMSERAGKKGTPKNLPKGTPVVVKTSNLGQFVKVGGGDSILTTNSDDKWLQIGPSEYIERTMLEPAT